MLEYLMGSESWITEVWSRAILLNFGRNIVNIISLLMHVIIVKWWILKLFKTISFCAVSLETNHWNVHCFTLLWGRHCNMDYAHLKYRNMKTGSWWYSTNVTMRNIGNHKEIVNWQSMLLKILLFVCEINWKLTIYRQIYMLVWNP